MSEQCRHTETQHFGADVHRCSRCGEIVEDRPMIAIPPVGECTFCRRSILECRCEAATREGPAQDMRVRYALRHDVIAHKAYTLGQCEGRDRIRELESRLAAAEAALAACEADTARLDWLSDPAKGCVSIGLNVPPLIPECSLYVFDRDAIERDEAFDACSLREAIDRARAPLP